MSSNPLSSAEITAALASLPGWKLAGDALVKTFEFGSFREAMSFMVRVGFEAESMGHHPEWTNIYDTVSIRLITHHVGNKITSNDVELGQRIEQVNWVK